MPRRARRSGVRFIKDDKDRSLAFSKYRSELFKDASDLSVLTGVRVAMVFVSETGKVYSFSTPKVKKAKAMEDKRKDEEDMARITSLQNELLQVEKAKAMEDKRKDENMAHRKEIQETSRFYKFLYGSTEDLDTHDLFEMYRELSRIKKEMIDQFPTFAP